MPVEQCDHQAVLYVSYDGMLEPLGRSQVLAYLKVLADRGWPIVLMSYEKACDWSDQAAAAELRDSLAASRIRWHPLRYHKTWSTVATAYDVVVGLAVAVRLTWGQGVKIVHARSYVAAIIACAIKRMFGLYFVFDMRGLWADERIDGGIWKRDSKRYGVAKWFEKLFLTRADAIISLSKAGIVALRELPYADEISARLQVVPTCADLNVFRPASEPPTSETVGATQSEFVLGYVGTVGIWYLFDEVLDFFQVFMTAMDNAKLMILNRGEHDRIREAVAAHEIPAHRVELISARHDEIAPYMRKMQAAAFFIKPVPSKRASCPTKLAELLGCGVPCLSNIGIGDVDEILSADRVGVLVRDFTRSEYAARAKELIELTQDTGTAQRCTEAARKHFSLSSGVDSYERVYREAIATGRRRRVAAR